MKNYYTIREELTQETLAQMFKITEKYKIYDAETFIIWFVNRFENEFHLPYFEEWACRYSKGTSVFISKMDVLSKEVFKEIFLK